MPEILRELQSGALAPAEAARRVREQLAQPLGFATVDHDRHRRCGSAEVIYGAGKTPEQVVSIARTIRARGHAVLVTRAAEAQIDQIKRDLADEAIEVGSRRGTMLIGDPERPDPRRYVIPIITAGTSDEPIAEEAALTCKALGHAVVRINDVGVAGLHRLGARLPQLRDAAVVICIAGMEGALPSVVGGLVSAPVIAVPTSVGYGAAFGGVAALLGMLTSCASGVSVVNIDNGFGAAYTACMINRQVVKNAGGRFPMDEAGGENPA